MHNDALDRLQEHYLRFVIAEGQAFEDKFGKTARRFFMQLPVLFHLYRRCAIDLELPSAARRLAAAALLYLVETEDFLREGAISAAESSIDDVWVAFESLRRLRSAVGDEPLSRHLHDENVWETVNALAENIDVISAIVPSRVLDQLQLFVS